MRHLLFFVAAVCFAQQSVTVSSAGASATFPVTPGSAPVTVTVPTPTAIITAEVTAQPVAITLPIEVVGPAGTTGSAQFVLPSVPSGALQLWLQIHNLDYDTEASVQLNNSVWLPLSTAAVTIQGSCALFGGIGGGCNTLSLTTNLPVSTVVAGLNTITFRFNGTDGIRSGFRVLGFNIQSAGANLIPASTFVEANPATWVPPLNTPADLAAGLALWQSAALTDPASGASVPIKAHCGDCHTIDGRDLKYFNYSNASIEARSVFHGLTAQQGAQIASYIRSLTTPSPGLPWNPPYQPAPGIDGQPVSNWAAGGGVSAVAGNDAAMQPYLLPGGSTAGISATAYLNPRQTPVTLQLIDWNGWLPTVHPMDGFATFAASAFYTGYLAVRSTLTAGAANPAAAYKEAVQGPWANWSTAGSQFYVAIQTAAPTGTWTVSQRQSYYSVGQWAMVKQWEINQDFGLEALASVPYGTKANPRGWFGAGAFAASPNIQHVQVGPGLRNGTQTAFDYASLAWYVLQLVLNDGQGQQMNHSPIDYGYVQGFIRNVFVVNSQQTDGMLALEFMLKNVQEDVLTGQPVSAPFSDGFDPRETNPAFWTNFAYYPGWKAYSASLLAQITTAYTQMWLGVATQYTPAQYYTGGWATATENPATDQWQLVLGGEMWYGAPRLSVVGVPAAVVNQYRALAQAIFPAGNWTLNSQAVCGAGALTGAQNGCIANGVNIF